MLKRLREHLRTFNFWQRSEVFGNSSKIFGSRRDVYGNLRHDKAKISRIWLRNSWQVYCWDVDRKNTKKNGLWIISVKTANCLCNALILSSHRMLARSQSSVGKFEIIGHLQQMVHDTHEFYSKIINEIWNISVLVLRLPLKTHIWSHRLMERVEQCYFKALKTGFVENKGQSGPLSADSKTQGKCQLSVKILAICQLSVNRIQTLMWE